MKKKIFVFLFDGFSDWEISYVTPEINKSGAHELVYFSKNGGPVLSMGGLPVTPSVSLKDFGAEDVDMLILPGGTAWEKGDNDELGELTRELFESGKPVAGICAATVFLGQLGILNNLKHTSNDLNYLKGIAQQYCGEENYQHSFAAADKNVITACGIAPVEFAREIFRAIGLFDGKDLEKWFQLFKNGVWSE
ncbi:MAG: glutamine amidotransferase [Cytophagales bacterium]|nr:glutamine amidotransferase [Cytophagales bacterium]